MSNPHGSGQEEQWSGLLGTICKTVAQRADQIDERRRTRLQDSIIAAWTQLTERLSSLDADRIQRRPDHQNLAGFPGYQALSNAGRQALNSLAQFADSPFSFVDDNQRSQVEDAVGQVLPQLMEASETAGITMPADAQTAYQQLAGSGQQGRRRDK